MISLHSIRVKDIVVIKRISEYDFVKGLEDARGIDILLYAVAKIMSESPKIRLQVRSS